MTELIHEWREWWKAQSPLRRTAPAAVAAIYLAALLGFDALRADHFFLSAIVLSLWYGGPRLRALFDFLIPLLLVGVIYDSMRIYGDLLRGPVHVEEPYHFDKKFFGIETSDGRLTPNEWWQKHTHPALDLVTGFFYLFFISIYVLISLFFCFRLPARGTSKRTPEWIRNQAYRPMWAFFFVNILGYSTYYWYPAAPPWYVADHGLGPADLTVAASAAGALRFDQLLGTRFFTEMYGRAADVFGAIPSLHVAYPLQSVFYAFRYGALRTFSVVFYLSMCFSAVYLNHHYILDILWGSAYALLVCWLLEIRNFTRSRAQTT